MLITGASRGIGHAIHQRAKELSDIEIVTPTRSEMDLACQNSVEEFLKETVPFDYIVNNAGINIIKPIEDISRDDFNKIENTNLYGPLKIIQHSVPAMKANKFGKIVNISSIWGVRSLEQRTLYSGTKFGLVGYTKALARELGPYNILINAVCPGFTATELTKQSLSVEDEQKLIAQVPLGRLATPTEIASVVLFLLSEENTYMTGQTHIVDGGFTS